MKKRLIVLIATLPAVLAAPASGSVTLGQLAPGSSPGASCISIVSVDRLQPAVSSGDSYVVPGAGVISSWSHNAAAGGSQTLTFKVFRPAGEPVYTVVAHDGPRPLQPSTVNTHPTSIPVSAGDIIGLNSGDTADTACRFDGPDYEFNRLGSLPDGQSGTFSRSQDPLYRLNISAVFQPTNTFTFGKVNRNTKKGTATLTLNVPNAGEVTVSGKGVKGASARAQTAKAVSAGTATVKIKAKGKQLKRLNATGKAKVKPKINYTPTGGDPSTQTLKLKLRKR